MEKVNKLRWLLLFKLFVFLFILAPKNSYAQDRCEKCKTRSVLVYDIDIQIPQAVNDSILAKRLRNFSESFFGIVHDAGGFICVEYMPASFSWEKPIPRPPQGAQTQWDYHISATISKQGLGFALNLLLETGRKSKVIARGSSQFTEDQLSTPKPIIDAFYNLTSKKDIYKLLYEYEKKQRDNNVEYAVQPIIKLHFPQTNIKQKDVLHFEVEAVDCDDEPLKNRKIIFEQPSIGSLDKMEIITDKNGKGALVYKAPAISGYASITAKYEFRYGYEKKDDESNSALDHIVVGDPEAPPFVRFDCDAHKKLKKSEKWATEQWPMYYYNNVEGNRGYLGYWKTQLPGSVVIKVYNKKGELIETGNIPKDDNSYIEIKKEATKRADIQIKKVKEIFEKYKSVPEYYFGLNQLLSFSYDLYKNSLDKEPEWDIKKAAADYNIDIAELLLKRVREKHDYLAADIVMYVAEQATKFKGEDKIAEYNQKLQNAMKFNFFIKSRHTWPGPFATDEENYEYNTMIDTWNYEAIQEKISGKITVTDNEGRKTGPISYDINFGWDLKRCEEEDPKEEKDEFTPAPLVKDKTNVKSKQKTDDDFTPAPLTSKKPKVEFIVGDFFGAPYLPRDPGDTGASVIPLGNLNASKTIYYTRQIDASGGGKENYSIKITVTHAPR